MKKFLSIGIITLLMAVGVQARPLPKVGERAFILPEGFTAAHNFEGIVALSNCSGSLVRLEGAKDTDNAMVLTNGHCLESGFPRYGTVVYKKASSRRFALLNANAVVLGHATATEIIYGTMTKTDMALYRLRETYDDIKKKHGINALSMLKEHPTVGSPIEVISGYWKRGYRCQIEAFVPKLVEGQWTSEDSIRYSRPGCEVIGGTSGSPIVLEGTRTVVGVNNTGNEDGERCTDNNPCEVDQNGNVFFEKGYSYGQQTFWVYSCLDAAGALDTSTAGCMLYH